MTLPNPLYYLGYDKRTLRNMKRKDDGFVQTAHVERPTRFTWTRLWTDEQVVEMIKDLMRGRTVVNLISQLRGGRDE